MFGWLKSKPSESDVSEIEFFQILAEFESIRFVDLEHMEKCSSEQILGLSKKIELGERLLGLNSAKDIGYQRLFIVGHTAIAFEMRGNCYAWYEPKKIDLAIHDYSRAFALRNESGDKNLAILESRCRCYLALYQFNKALIDANEIIQCAKESQSYLLRSHCYIALGDHTKAIADANYALEIADSYTERKRAYQARGEIYQMMENHEAAAHDFEQARKQAELRGY